jgi:6-pyruvoyltetrahydropterin/6-carboxytetrahydropterin synthase
VSIIAEMAKEFRFEAAHFLPNVPKSHQCHKIHGHSYLVTLRARGVVDEKLGWVMDLTELSQAFLPLLGQLDHALLNEIEGLENPTGENVAIWIITRLGKIVPQLSSVTVKATNRIAITVTRQGNELSLFSRSN